MKTSRRKFIGASAALATSCALPSLAFIKQPSTSQTLKERFDPWVEVFPEAIKYNAKVLYNLSGKKPVWVATIPIGHADGYLRRAVDGAKVLVNGNLYPVIGAVSASHTILEIGEYPTVKVGDIATLVGPDHPEIHPSHLSLITGVSVYDVLMHMSARLPKVMV